MKRLILALLLILYCSLGMAQDGGELRFCLRSDPKTFDPSQVADDASETVRYLTGGVLVRFNRRTQALEPELATSWKVMNGGRQITFKLREGISFSDGTPFTSDDVDFTIKKLMDPALHSPTGDAFRSAPGAVTTRSLGKYQITVTFPAPIAGLDKLFDQVAIMSAHSAKSETAVLGPFAVADYKPGSYLLLRRNGNYWKKDAAGKPLPYLTSIRLDILQNRETELLRLRRGELQLINQLDSELYDRLQKESPGITRDAGPSLDTEQFWFNQVKNAPIPQYKLAWFRSSNFRRAISSAINRGDIARLVYGTHAQPAMGPISPANRFWFNQQLKPHAFDQKLALALLAKDGFGKFGSVLKDREGHDVEFSIITNAGNRPRERMATLIQQDLSSIGIKVSIVTLDFPSLIERITQTFNYEACILGLVNTDLDPNGQMNVWLSSSENHQWNPGQKTPETPWEAEIDRLMRAQASESDLAKRKKYFDRVQQIAWDEAPFLYLVNKNALSAVATSVRGADPVALRPQTYWNIETLSVAGAAK